MDRLTPFFTSRETRGRFREPRLPSHAQNVWNEPGYRDGYLHCGHVAAFGLVGGRPVWHINGYRFIWSDLVELAELTLAEQQSLIETFDLNVQVCQRVRTPFGHVYLEPPLRIETRTYNSVRLSAHDPATTYEYSWPVYGRIT